MKQLSHWSEACQCEMTFSVFLLDQRSRTAPPPPVQDLQEVLSGGQRQQLLLRERLWPAAGNGEGARGFSSSLGEGEQGAKQSQLGHVNHLVGLDNLFDELDELLELWVWL